MTISAKVPWQHETTVFKGKYASSIARWLKTESGYQGHLVGELASPVDAFIALSRAEWLTFEIVSGRDILNLPIPSVPEDCIS